MRVHAVVSKERRADKEEDGRDRNVEKPAQPNAFARVGIGLRGVITLYEVLIHAEILQIDHEAIDQDHPEGRLSEARPETTQAEFPVRSRQPEQLRRRFGRDRDDKDADKALEQIGDLLPSETVTDEYGTRLRWNEYTESIYKRMPNDSRRLQEGETRWQILLAPKYIRNRIALTRFLAVVRESDAGDAYLYYPLGAIKPVVWFRNSRYTLDEFDERYGKD